MKEILKRIQIEQRKEVLKAAKENIKINGIDMVTPRGTINISNKIITDEVIRVIDAELEDINIQLEEMTGLNIEKLERLNMV